MLFHKGESAGSRVPGGGPAGTKARRREGRACGGPGARHRGRWGGARGEGAGPREGGLVPGARAGEGWEGPWGGGGTLREEGGAGPGARAGDGVGGAGLSRTPRPAQVQGCFWRGAPASVPARAPVRAVAPSGRNRLLST